MRRSTKRAVAIATGLIVFAGAGLAYAYWTAGGDGTGSAPTGTSTALVVNQNTVVDPMFPGDTAQTLSGDFDNTSDGTVHVSTVTVSIASVFQGADPAVGCSADDYTLTGAEMAAVQEVPVGTAEGNWTGATIKFNNTTDNQDACKGATVNLAYVVD